MENDIFIIGAGTYGETMYELAETLGYTVKGFYDDNFPEMSSQKIKKLNVLGKYKDLPSQSVIDKKFIVAIGDNKTRYQIMQQITKFGGIIPTLIHPSAIISPSATVGEGVYIQANVYIWAKVKVDNYSIISPGVVVAHHSIVGKACLISTLTAVGASITVSDKVFLGMNSTIVTGVNSVGENSIVGAGAVVLNDIERNSIYAGVPAKKIRDLS